MQREFTSLVEFAKDVAATNPSSLVDIVRMYLRPLQSQMIIDAAQKGVEQDVPSIDERDFFWNGQFQIFSQLRRTRRSKKICKVRLDRDVILPWPWHRERLIQSLISIGPGRPWKRWKQDEMNHLVHVWLPWGIAFVGGGNHSIAAGILGAAGEIVPTEIHDMSGIFKQVVCNGMDYSRKDDGATIAQVRDPRIAAVFEIGRLMHKLKVSPW
jgi:hypothetical protein